MYERPIVSSSMASPNSDDRNRAFTSRPLIGGTWLQHSKWTDSGASNIASSRTDRCAAPSRASIHWSACLAHGGS